MSSAVFTLASCTSIKSPAESCIQAYNVEAKANHWEGVKLLKVGSSVKYLRIIPEKKQNMKWYLQQYHSFKRIAQMYLFLDLLATRLLANETSKLLGVKLDPGFSRVDG
jgi:hypothetical protein